MSINSADFNDLPVDDDQVLIPDYPVVAWVYGNPAMREASTMSHAGGWFIDAQSAPGGTMPEPWQTWARPVKTGQVEGFAALQISVAVIRQRRAWFWTTGESSQQYPWTMYDQCQAQAQQFGERARGRLQLLCALKGVEAMPVVLTFKGAGSQAMAGTRRDPGVMTLLDQGLVGGLKRAIRASGGKGNATIPRYAFWMRLGTGITDNGQPAFVTVGSGNQSQTLSVPTAHDVHPSKLVGVDDFESYFVGRDLMHGPFSDWFEESEDWAKAWDQRQDAEAGEARPQAPAPSVASDRNGDYEAYAAMAATQDYDQSGDIPF